MALWGGQYESLLQNNIIYLSLNCFSCIIEFKKSWKKVSVNLFLWMGGGLIVVIETLICFEILEMIEKETQSKLKVNRYQSIVNCFEMLEMIELGKIYTQNWRLVDMKVRKDKMAFLLLLPPCLGWGNGHIISLSCQICTFYIKYIKANLIYWLSLPSYC